MAGAIINHCHLVQKEDERSGRYMNSVLRYDGLQ